MRFSPPGGVVSAFAIALLAACGTDDQRLPGAAVRELKPDATAEDAARAMRTGLRCPPPSDTMPRRGEAVDDLVGVRPGMPLTQAATIVLCSNPLLVAEYDSTRNRFGINKQGANIREGVEIRPARVRQALTPQQVSAGALTSRYMYGDDDEVRPGEAIWSISAIGLPGAERVTDVVREEHYASGVQPTAEMVATSLIEKYGKPTTAHEDVTSFSVWWVWDIAGHLVSPEAAEFDDCRVHGARSIDVSFHSRCGTAVAIWARRAPDNPLLVQELHVRVLDHARSYERIRATESALRTATAERQAAEAKSATRKGTKPVF